jgi:hypothetical protein
VAAGSGKLAVVLLLGCALLQASASVAVGLRIEVETVDNKYLDIKLISDDERPLLLTLRQLVGAYLDIQIIDETGRAVPYGGEVAKPLRATADEFRLLEANQFFGRRVSLRSRAAFDLVPGRAYDCVVTYRNQDWTGWLSENERRLLRRKWGVFDVFDRFVRSSPVRIRLQ